MATRKTPLKITLAPRAIEALKSIWRWNADRYGEGHANAYIQFLDDCIRDLSITYATGKIVKHRSDLRYIVMRKKPKGHGHIAVYRLAAGEVHVSHIFHTAQDWQHAISS